MKTIIKIAWRNIWRNRLRSGVVIGSILIGIWAGVSVGAFSYGLNSQRTESMISNNLSHIQIHRNEWKEEQKIGYWMNNVNEIENQLKQDPNIAHISSRVKINAMVASARYTSGLVLLGIDPIAENQLTGLEAKVDSGAYFDEAGRNPIIIGEALAEKLKVHPGNKIIITFTDEHGDIISAAFKVKGFYNAHSSQIEKMQAFVRKSDLLTLLGKTSGAHEIAMTIVHPEQIDQVKAEVESKIPNLLVQSWKDLSPELAFSDELMATMLYIIMGIIMLALCFGIVNTMLMAVLERKKELGMLMGIGMSKRKIFSMIMLETLMLALCGGPLGILLGFLTVSITGKTGFDLSFYSEGLASFGIDTIIYPQLETGFYFGTGIMVFGITLIAAIWPARRALKLNPVETIRTI